MSLFRKGDRNDVQLLTEADNQERYDNYGNYSTEDQELAELRNRLIAQGIIREVNDND